MIALGIMFAKHVDLRRWQRYQFERDMYFRQHPLYLQCGEQFEIALHLNKTIQKKLVNELMLKPSDQSVFKKALIQRDADSTGQKYNIKVSIQDKTYGYLDFAYADELGEQLKYTDFEIGRAIEILVEIIVFKTMDFNEMRGECGCRVRLDLPRDPRMVSKFLVEKIVSEHVEQ